MSLPEPLYLGIDFGTSGARAIAIDTEGQMQAQASVAFGADPTAGREAAWQTTLFELLESLPLAVRQAVRAIAINGTSSTGDRDQRYIVYRDALRCRRTFFERAVGL